MSREFQYYNPNPLSRNVGDCAVRAVSAALDVDWETAYDMIAEAGRNMADMPSSNEVWGALLRSHGFRKALLPRCPDCYTAEEFARENPEGTFVIGLDHHVACIRDGRILDSWDSSGETAKFVWYRRDGK
jgi:hypothetical protein